MPLWRSFCSYRPVMRRATSFGSRHREPGIPTVGVRIEGAKPPGPLQTVFVGALKFVARPERLELPTSWSVARRSIQLSYGRANVRRLEPRRLESKVGCRPPDAKAARTLPRSGRAPQGLLGVFREASQGLGVAWISPTPAGRILACPARIHPLHSAPTGGGSRTISAFVNESGAHAGLIGGLFDE